MHITRAYKTELDLNNVQITACKQHAGAARFAYNWGLQRKREAYQATGHMPSAIDLHRELNTLKKTELPWMYDVSKCAPQEALRNLDNAFAHFLRRRKLRQEGKLKGKLGYPQPKTKKRGIGNFRLTGRIVVLADAIQLPRLGRVRLKERGYLPPTGTPGVRLLSATISEQAGHWYVSVQVEHERAVPINIGPIVGVDLGIKTLATCSDGTRDPNPHHLKRRLKQIKRLHRMVSRRKKGSENRTRAVRKLAAQYRRVTQLRANTLHQLTSRLAKTKAVVVIEDLNVAGMLSNHHLAQAIGDVGFYEFRRQLVYKATWYGCRVVIASRWEPSSRTCSQCGWVDAQLTLSDRIFHCQNPRCGLVLDRDLNAAINLEQLAGSSSDSRNACGEDGADRGRRGYGETVLGEAGTEHVVFHRGRQR